MPLGKTEFRPGFFVSFTLETLPKLFSTLGAVSRKGFFQKIGELDGPGGEGIPLEKYIEMINIGLEACKPGITIEETRKVVSEFVNENGLEALEEFIVDAFGDAKLSDKEYTDKKKELIKELRTLELSLMEAKIHERKTDIDSVEQKIAERVADLGNRKNLIVQNQPKKKRT